MAIANKFLHFSTKASFLTEISKYVTYNESDDTYTVKIGREDDWKFFRNFTSFIKDTKQIWTHETFYDCSINANSIMKGSQYLLDYNNQNQKVGIGFDGTKLTSSTCSFLAGYKTVPKQGLIAGIQPVSNTEAAKIIGQNSANIAWNGNIQADHIVRPTTSYTGTKLIDDCMISDFSANRFAFLKPGGVTVEYSTDGGVSWVDSGLGDVKTELFTIGRPIYIGGRTTSADTNYVTTNDLVRVTIDSKAANCYCNLNKIAIYCFANGSKDCWMDIDIATNGNPDNFTKLINYQLGSTSGGWIIINFAYKFTYGNSTSQYQYWRFTFGVDTPPTSGNRNGAFSVNKIYAYGNIIYSAPSKMAETGHLYSYDYLQNATFPNTVTANKFVTSGGKSTQFVKGDGSLSDSIDTNSLTISSGVNKKIILNNTDSETNYSEISFQQNGIEYNKIGPSQHGETLLSANGGIIATRGWIQDQGYLTSVPTADTSTAGLVSTTSQTFAGQKTFNSGIICTSNNNSWCSSFNYKKAAIGVKQTNKNAVCSAITIESAEDNKRYFQMGTFGNKLLICSSTEVDNWNHNWIDGGIFIETNGCTNADDGTWKFGGFTSYPASPK